MNKCEICKEPTESIFDYRCDDCDLLKDEKRKEFSLLYTTLREKRISKDEFIKIREGLFEEIKEEKKKIISRNLKKINALKKKYLR